MQGALRHAPATLVWQAGAWLQQSAQRIDAWLCERAKSRDDSLALEGMSDRELRDIGLSPALRTPCFASDSWSRDWSV